MKLVPYWYDDGYNRTTLMNVVTVLYTTHNEVSLLCKSLKLHFRKNSAYEALKEFRKRSAFAHLQYLIGRPLSCFSEPES